MTTEEFDREFDILYNNIMSNAAPSIDAYEKSVFLSKAQEEVLNTLYENSFESSEKLTESLKDLVITTSYNSKSDYVTPSFASELIDSSDCTKLFALKENVLYIVFESILLNNGKRIPVKPVRHDEYARVRNNPFKRARKNEALRVTANYKVIDSDKKERTINALEVISPYKEYIYTVRYIRKPKPIILYNEEGLSIDGYDSVTECELPEIWHRTILDIAVKYAAATYKQ